MLNNNQYLYVAIFFLFIFKFIFLQFDYIARYSPVDDNLFVGNAYLLINNSNEYFPLTLSKLPSFSYLLYLLNKFSISYFLFLNFSLFFLSVAWIKSKYNNLNTIENIGILFLINLNPVIFSTDWNVLMREPVLAISTILLIFVGFSHEKKYTKTFLIIFYPLLIFMFFLREEILFIYSLIVTLLLIFNSKFNIFYLTKFLIVPLLLFSFVFTFLSFNNQKKYDVAIVNDFIQGEFPIMLQNIVDINDNKPIQINIPITTNKIKLLYDISPTAKKVYSILPNVGVGTASCVDHNICNEMSLGYIVWWLKTNPYEFGFVDNHQSEQLLYKKISEEIVYACNNSSLDCSSKRLNVDFIFIKYFYDLYDLILNFFIYPVKFDDSLLRNYDSYIYSETLKNNIFYTSASFFNDWRYFLGKIYPIYSLILMFMFTFSLFGSFYYHYVKKKYVSSYSLSFNFFIISYLMILGGFSIFAGPFDARMILSLNIFISFFVYQSFKEILIRFFSK